MARVARVGDHRDARVGDRRGHTLRDVDVLGVERADDQQHRHRRARSSRSQFDGCAPCPSMRSWCVSDPTVWPARRSSSPARSRGSVAKSGCATQRSRNASTPSRSMLLREPLRRLRHVRRVRRVGDARRRAHQHESLHDVRADRARAAGRAARPASTRRTSARRRRRAAAAVATKSRSSAGAQTVRGASAQQFGHRLPRGRCLREAVHEDEVGAHGGILA